MISLDATDYGDMNAGLVLGWHQVINNTACRDITSSTTVVTYRTMSVHTQSLRQKLEERM